MFSLPLLCAEVAHAGLRVPVHGNLTDPASAPLDGDHVLRFELFDAATGGEAVFAETHPSVTVSGGRFTVYLGATADKLLPTLFRDHEELWLQVTVGTDDLLEPRIRMGATPYAGFANHSTDATQLAGRNAADYALIEDVATVATTGSYADLVGAPAPYQAGNGLELTGSTFSLNETSVQSMCLAATDDAGYVRESALSSGGGDVNDSSNPMDWTRLKSVPADIADGDQDTQLTEVQVQNYAVNQGFLRDVGTGSANSLAVFDGTGSLATEGSDAVEIHSGGERVLRIENREDTVLASTAVILGYWGNTISDLDSDDLPVLSATISGGGAESAVNTVTASGGTIGGGSKNTVSGLWGTVPGGYLNVASGQNAFAAGERCQATNFNSIAIGDDSQATGAGAFALGGNARSDANGCFVWGSGFSTTRCTYDGADPSDAINRFVVRAEGGVHLLSSNDNVTGVRLPPDGSSWDNLSDRNQKHEVVAVDVLDVLKKVAALPMSTWSYNAEGNVRHLGPMAQDFHGAFGLGTGDTRISTIDGFGVALAAVQGLERENETLRSEVAKLRDQNAKQLAEMEKRLRSLEAR